MFEFSAGFYLSVAGLNAIDYGLGCNNISHAI